METYVGHRYVPKIMGVWNKLSTYENLSIVTYDNSSYTSKTIVPVGVEISNEKYWVKTGDYNAQVEEFKNDTTAQLEQTTINLNSVNKKIKNTVKPKKITNVDDFTIDDSMYENASSIVDSTLSINTTSKELTVSVGSGGITKSAKAHRVYSFGRNIMINTVFKGGTTSPQIHLRLNQKDNVGSYAIYKPTNSTKLILFVINNDTGVFSEFSTTISIDGIGTDDIDISVRTFGKLIDVFARQKGILVGTGRYLIEDFGLLKGIGNGLGTSSSSVYKTYLKAMEIGEYINVICLGDSNTLGNGLTTKQKYPSQLQNRFFEQNVGVLNKGVSGDTSSRVVARLATDVYKNKIEGARNIVVLQIGTNDAGAKIDANTTYANIINNLVKPIQENGFEVWLCTVPARGDYLPALTIIKELNPLILADKNADRIIDLYSMTVDSTDVYITDFVQSDMLHFSERGANIMASLVAGEINK